MTDKTKKETVVFYSWQSDLPDITNRSAIRKALTNAINNLNSGPVKGNTIIKYDEATRGVPGSPNIPLTILDKITESDIFICDITTINYDACKLDKNTPNPNVIFELGYAVAKLGWGRIILLFNTHYGLFPQDVPFDIDRHRISKYEAKPATNSKTYAGQLETLINKALSEIIKWDPPRPVDIKILGKDEIQKNRDIEFLKWVLKNISLLEFDHYFEHAPRMITMKFVAMWDIYANIVKSSTFHVYDVKAAKYLKELYKYWERCMAYPEEYELNQTTGTLFFRNPKSAPFSESQKIKWAEIEKYKIKLKNKLISFINYVRSEYMEIEI